MKQLTQKKERRIRHYGLSEKTAAKEGWFGPVERPPCPRKPSIVDLYACPVCKDYMLEGSKAQGWCTRCGTRHPLAA